jgi:hypothetical protein
MAIHFGLSSIAVAVNDLRAETVNKEAEQNIAGVVVIEIY